MRKRLPIKGYQDIKSYDNKKIARALKRENIKIRHKLISSLSKQFPPTILPREQTSGVIYKICCSDFDFAYYDQSDRALIPRIIELRFPDLKGDQC